MDPSARPSVKMVGDAFVEQYYALMKKSPEHLSKVYRDNCEVSRIGLDGKMHVSNFSDIDAKYLDMLSCCGFDSVEVTSVMVKYSHGGGIIVSVDGYFALKERPARNFTQSFFLVPQATEYVVFRDVFKFLDISEANAFIPPPNNVVHFKNLPKTATHALIENAFKKFGPIKIIKIEIPASKQIYGKETANSGNFVEFEEADAAKRALMASPVRMDGGQVYVTKMRGALKSHMGQDPFDQNRYGNDQVRGKGLDKFWESQKSMEGQSTLQEEAGGTRLYDFWDLQKSKEEQSKLQEEAGGTRASYLQTSMEGQSKLHEESGGPRFYDFWDF